MSSSGLIYAVIVGAWAAYLVPMWLRRQDELNEARPTERFSTAIRLLSGRAAMERKVSRHREGEAQDPTGAPPPRSGAASAIKPAAGSATPPRPAQPEPQRPAPQTAPPAGAGPAAAAVAPDRRADAQRSEAQRSEAQRSEAQQRRASLLARRRRMVILLFAAFTLGMVAAAVGGVALLWLPAVPAVLFSVYIAHLRRQERRRFEVKIDRRRAAEAAQRVRERERDRRRAAAVPETQAVPAPAPTAPGPAAETAQPAGRTASGSGLHRTRALVEAAAAAEESEDWHDGPRDQSGDAEGWDPVPVPLPTYVTAPVAPRRTGGLDLGAPDTWSAGRAVVPPPQPHPQPQQAPAPRQQRPPSTPLFDQYADEPASHPRAANE
ncbi:gephyrin-like molybdotransferase receptor GlpR [Streptacidiphilus sp. N1-10]|uniref:Gephyrin-like molybdotransferase receptor GlpR n=1 Tax=Streptacidiphilus jeojiensis TaxID=3229225 RepID=A0ABV6XU17_9ACTN